MTQAAGMLIVGAGECGARAAFALREAGYAGPVTLIGAEDRLPYERPPLSKGVLQADVAPEPKTIALAGQWQEAGIACRTGAVAEEIDRARKSVRLAGGTHLSYEKLLLCTGAMPRPLPLAGVDPACFGYLRTFDDALRIRSALLPGTRLVIIGGGFVGLELAASARARGLQVCIIEVLPRILSRGVPAEIADVIGARHRAEGVALRCGGGIVGVAAKKAGTAITLDSGETVEADFLVIGIGALPKTELATAAGLATDNGIAVDNQLCTSDPDIYAAGDCCSFPLEIYGQRRVRLESWRNAHDQGNLAARNMLGAGETISALPWFWSTQYDLTLQIAGLPDQADVTVRRDLEHEAFILFHLSKDGRLVAASGIGTGNTVAKDIRLAEILINRSAAVSPSALADPDVRLKSLFP
jgi:3-phenylpropionate/trans-cinnamate dioxygenase ferredoxin reductase subunit